MQKKKYWSVDVVAQTGRPGDINPVAVFKVITMDGGRPSDGDMVEVCILSGIKRGRVPIFQYGEIARFDLSIEECHTCGKSQTWIIKAPFDGKL